MVSVEVPDEGPIQDVTSRHPEPFWAVALPIRGVLHRSPHTARIKKPLNREYGGLLK